MDHTPSPTVTDVTSTEALFSEVKDSFLQSITDEERAQFSSCRSPEELVKSIATFLTGFEKSRFTRMTMHIESFSKQLQPYFDILGIVVQSHPEWAAIAWGSFRLVLKACEHIDFLKHLRPDSHSNRLYLQLASNYSWFFERLAGLLDEIGRSLPQFNDILRLIVTDTEHRVSQRLQLSIRSFYVDLFHLFQAIAGVFTRKSSSK